MRIITLSLAVLLGLAAAESALAQNAAHNRYRWRDAQGNLHFDDSLPAEALQLGYDIVNAQGLVVKHVDKPKSAEELKADEKAAADRDEQKRIADEQARRDQQFLAAYPNEQELASALHAQIDMIDQSIHATEISLQSQEKSLTEMLSHAADLDRNGKPVPATLQSQIDALRVNIEKQKAFIVERQQQKVDAEKKNEAEIARYRELQAHVRH
ncbi:MAG TPA: DUF4124 domain-containing protein [Rudaea sp.]|nr:DUF4124 domain-containing protein [Rudaea sp.]